MEDDFKLETKGGKCFLNKRINWEVDSFLCWPHCCRQWTLSQLGFMELYSDVQLIVCLSGHNFSVLVHSQCAHVIVWEKKQCTGWYTVKHLAGEPQLWGLQSSHEPMNPSCSAKWKLTSTVWLSLGWTTMSTSLRCWGVLMLLYEWISCSRTLDTTLLGKLRFPVPMAGKDSDVIRCFSASFRQNLMMDFKSWDKNDDKKTSECKQTARQQEVFAHEKLCFSLGSWNIE